jgi:tetratricopeptide (TPR) repeat protein
VLSVFSVVALLASLLLAKTAGAEGEDLDAAEALLAQGKAVEAVEAFRRLADASGGAPGGASPDVLSGLGRALLAAGDASAALHPLGEAAKKRGSAADRVTFAEALVAHVRARLEAGPVRSVDATPYLQDALQQAETASGDPTFAARAARVVGEAKYLQGDLPGARAALSAPALAADAYAQDLLARACYQAGDFAAAADAWTAAGNALGAASAWAAAKDRRATAAYLALVAKAPGDWGLLEAGYRAARYTGDLAAFDAGLAGLPAPEAAVWAVARARGRVAEALGRPEAAADLYAEVAKRRPEDASAWSDVGRARLRSGPDDPAAVSLAVEAFRKALALDAADPSARDELSWVAGRAAARAHGAWPDRGPLDRSIEVSALLAETDPTDAVAWRNLGNQRRVASDAAGSLDAYEKAVDANPYDAAIASDRGLALRAAGREDEALAQFEKAVEIDGAAISPRQNAGRIRWLRGEYDAAEAHYAAALRASRTTGGKPLLFRFLIDRCWRARARPDAR